MNTIAILRILLIAFTAIFVVVFAKDLIAHKEELKGKDRWIPLAFIGSITDFFDTWGIGCFATTQAGFKFTKTCPDAEMPGTLNVGHTLPVVTEALLFFSFVDIDSMTLYLMIAAAVAGSVHRRTRPKQNVSATQYCEVDKAFYTCVAPSTDNKAPVI